MNKQTFLSLYSGQSNDLDSLGDSVEKLDSLQRDFDWSQSGFIYRTALNVFNFLSLNWKELRPFMFGVKTRENIQKEITTEVNTISTKVAKAKPSDQVQTTLKDCVVTAYSVVGIKQYGLLAPTKTWGEFINGLLTAVPGLSKVSQAAQQQPQQQQPSSLIPAGVPMLQFTRKVGETTPELPRRAPIKMASKASSLF